MKQTKTITLLAYELIDRRDEFVYSEVECTITGYRVSVLDLLASGDQLITSFEQSGKVYLAFKRES